MSCEFSIYGSQNIIKELENRNCTGKRFNHKEAFSIIKNMGLHALPEGSNVTVHKEAAFYGSGGFHKFEVIGTKLVLRSALLEKENELLDWPVNEIKEVEL